MDGLQCFTEGAHVTHVSIVLCPISKCCPPIILQCPKFNLDCTAGSLVCSLGSLIVRFCKQTIMSGAFLFEQLLDFLVCIIKPVSEFPGREANNFSRGFLWYGYCSCQLRVYLGLLSTVQNLVPLLR